MSQDAIEIGPACHVTYSPDGVVMVCRSHNWGNESVLLNPAESLALLRFLEDLLPSAAAAAQAEQEADWLDALDCETCRYWQWEFYDACHKNTGNRPRKTPAYCDTAASMLRQYAARNHLERKDDA
jgi:hypothetical protein